MIEIHGVKMYDMYDNDCALYDSDSRSQNLYRVIIEP